MKNIFFLWKTTKGYRFRMLLLLFCILTATFTASVMPYILGEMVDEGIVVREWSRFIFLTMQYSAFYFCNQLCHLLLNYIWARLEVTYLLDIKRNILKKIIYTSDGNAKRFSAGDIISRMNADTEQVLELIHNNILYTLGTVLNLVTSVCFMIILNTTIGIIMFFVAIFNVIGVTYFSRRISKFQRDYIGLKASLSSWIFEILLGLQELKVVACINKIMWCFREKQIENIRGKISVDKREVESECCSNGLNFLSQIILYILIAIAAYKGHMKLGGLVAMVAYFNTSISALKILSKKGTRIAKNMASVERIRIIYEIQGQVMPLSGKGFEMGDIEYRNVSFGYQNNLILQDVSLRIQQGSHVAIVGESGCGKSTFVKLLNRLCEKNKGEIFINGEEITNYSLKELRNNIACVYQKNTIFKGSVRYNVLLSNDDKRDGEVWDILELLNLKKLVQNFPNKLDTVLDSRCNLSGGEKQRIVVARQLLKNTPILIMDEATSALDAENEEIINGIIKKIKNKKIIISITHRLQSIKEVDKIVVLYNNRILDIGTHNELYKRCSYYKELFNAAI